LRMSQALGQSAYITGFGVGKSKFGWIFGRNLGDDTITPGNRTLFALVAIPNPKTAGTKASFKIKPSRAEWFKDQSDVWYRHPGPTIPEDPSYMSTFDALS